MRFLLASLWRFIGYMRTRWATRGSGREPVATWLLDDVKTVFKEKGYTFGQPYRGMSGRVGLQVTDPEGINIGRLSFEEAKDGSCKLWGCYPFSRAEIDHEFFYQVRVFVRYGYVPNVAAALARAEHARREKVSQTLKWRAGHPKPSGKKRKPVTGPGLNGLLLKELGLLPTLAI